jgi:hypothetical protein
VHAIGIYLFWSDVLLRSVSICYMVLFLYKLDGCNIEKKEENRKRAIPPLSLWPIRARGPANPPHFWRAAHPQPSFPPLFPFSPLDPATSRLTPARGSAAQRGPPSVGAPSPKP